MKDRVSSAVKSQGDFNNLPSEQVTAQLPQSDNALFFDKSQDFSDTQGSEANTPTLIEKHTLFTQGPKDRPKEAANRVRRKRKSHQKKGGWPIARYIPHNEVITILDGIHKLRRIERPLNHFVTLRPPVKVEGGQPQKIWCRRKIQDIQRKLKRRGQEFVALFVYEKKEGGPIHVHILVHVPKRLSQWFIGLHNPPEIDVRLARPDHSLYIVKNRRWQGPERERWLRKELGLRWQKGDGFRGKRWGWTAAAKALLDKL